MNYSRLGYRTVVVQDTSRTLQQLWSLYSYVVVNLRVQHGSSTPSICNWSDFRREDFYARLWRHIVLRSGGRGVSGSKVTQLETLWQYCTRYRTGAAMRQTTEPRNEVRRNRRVTSITCFWVAHASSCCKLPWRCAFGYVRRNLPIRPTSILQSCHVAVTIVVGILYLPEYKTLIL